MTDVKATYMKQGDYHIVVAASQHHFQVYNYEGQLAFEDEVRCDGTAGPGWQQHNGDTPPGIYRLGTPVWTLSTDDFATVKAPFGPVFTPLIFLEGPFGAELRQGLGDHAGGSGLEDPMADEQGWVVTHGCCRFQGKTAKRIAYLVDALAKAGKYVYQSVTW
jgi:hypothetical protein